MIGLGFVTKSENLSVAYMNIVKKRIRVKKPPTIVFIVSYPLILKLGKGDPKASIFLNASPVVNHDLLLELLKFFC